MGDGPGRQDGAGTDPITEDRVAELEAEWHRLERHVDAAKKGEHAGGVRVLSLMGDAGVAEAEKAFLAARARLDRQQRIAADQVTAQTLAANVAMAEASKVAANASADAARWAKWAAIFAAAAAVLDLVASFLSGNP